MNTEKLTLVLDIETGKVHIEYINPLKKEDTLLGSECTSQDPSHMSRLCDSYSNHKEDLLYMREDIKTYILDGLFIRSELLSSPTTEEPVRRFLEEKENFHFGKECLCQSCFGKFFSFVSEEKTIEVEGK